MIGIYKIENTVNGKVYIGKAGDISKRWCDHMRMLETKTHHSYKLQEDFNKYGILRFTFSVICLCESDELAMKEKEYSDLYDSLNSGYNVAEISLPHDIYDAIKQTNGKITNELLNEDNRQLIRRKIRFFDESNKLNTRYNDEFDISHRWFTKDTTKDRVPQLKNDLYNYVKNHLTVKESHSFSWTTYYEYKDIVKAKGSIKKFTSIGSDRNIRKSKHLAFLCNIFHNDFKIRDLDIEEQVQKDKIPLMVLVRWILANMDKNEDVVTLYLPSKRMRDLLKEWLEGDVE